MSLLFCDLIGSTELANRLDVEDWQSLAADYQRAATDACTRYGGHVAKYLGDGVVVYFGYPLAHEEDPERAVRAGLAILDEMAAINNRLATDPANRLGVRIGIHTGEVVISQGGGGEHEVYGDAPNLAARLQGVAPPDTVVISGATLKLVGGIFITEELGPQTLKGFAEPIMVHRVVAASGVRSRLETARRAALVGRRQELDALRDRWRRARAGAGGAALVRAEPGMGKSRLVTALHDSLADEAHTWLECRCTPFTQNSALHPFIDLLRRWFLFAPGDDAAARIGKIEQGLTTAGLSLPDTVPLFMHLLSIPFGHGYTALDSPAEVIRERTLEALSAGITGLSALQPLLLLVEDAHWCDPSSLALIRRMIAQADHAPILVLMAARPEFDPDWTHVEEIVSVRLERLDEEDSREAIERLSAGRPLPPSVVSAIVERSDGNPLYIEELVHAALESGHAPDAEAAVTSGHFIPATLQDSLMARLDRLGPARELAMRAAVIGREFRHDLLFACSLRGGTGEYTPDTLEEGLGRLVEAGVLFVHGVAPASIYVFKHALIQEAAYHTLLRRKRQELHALVARVLEEVFPRRAENEAEVVARHFEAAGRARSAVACYQRAGVHAAARTAYEEAILHLRNALRLLETLPPAAERDLLELGLQLALAPALVATRGYPHPETRAAYERALTLCDAGEAVEGPLLAASLAGVAVCSTSSGQFDRGIAFAERLLAEPIDGDSHLLLANIQIAIPRFLQGKYAIAVDHCDRLLAIYDPARHSRDITGVAIHHGVAAYLWSMWSCWFLGRGDEALRRADAAVSLGRQLDHPHSVTVALLWNAFLHYWRRDMTRAIDFATQTIEYGEPLGFLPWMGQARLLRSAAQICQTRDPAALGEAVAGFDEVVRYHQGAAPFVYGMLAEAYFAVGDFEAALETINNGAKLAEMTGQPVWDPEFHRLKGEVLLARSGASAEAQAESLFREAFAIAERNGAAALELRAVMSQARLMIRHGDAARAAALVRPVYERITEGRDTADLIEAAALASPGAERTAPLAVG